MHKKTLLYYETADKIREYIISEKLQPGAFLPPERTLAVEFGVSVVTLKKSLKYLCDEKVLKTVPRRGTKVNVLPDAYGPPLRKRIGLTVWKDSDVFHPDAIRLISTAGDVFPADRYEIIMVYISREMISSGSWGKFFPSSLDAMLVAVQEIPEAMLNDIKSSSVPAVFIEHAGFSPGVWISEAPGITKLMRYLVSLGHEKIAFVSGPASLAMVREQTQAFRDFAAENRLPANDKYTAPTLYERKSAFTETLRLLEMKDAPTAILLGNEFMAQGALDALQSKGLKCPDDVSVACFGGISMSQQSYPQLSILSTVFDRSPGLFRTGAQMLRDILEKRAAETSVIMERELIVRESTAQRYR